MDLTKNIEDALSQLNKSTEELSRKANIVSKVFVLLAILSLSLLIIQIFGV